MCENFVFLFFNGLSDFRMILKSHDKVAKVFVPNVNLLWYRTHFHSGMVISKFDTCERSLVDWTQRALPIWNAPDPETHGY